MRLPFQHPKPRGFTLVEISLVMALIIALGMSVGLSVTSIRGWEKAKNASIALQAVYSAQRAYLADHPTTEIASVTAAQLLPYLPEGWSAIPVVKGLNDESLLLDHTVMPPRLRQGVTTYDPTNKSNDGLWDVGE